MQVRLAVLGVVDRGYDKIVRCSELEGDRGVLRDPVELIFDDKKAADEFKEGDRIVMTLDHEPASDDEPPKTAKAPLTRKGRGKK